MASDSEISAFLQRELGRLKSAEVTAVQAAAWLDHAGLLSDSPSRRGKPLRVLLRSGKIAGSEQRPPKANGRWFITRVDGDYKSSESQNAVVDDRGRFADEGNTGPALSRDLQVELERALAKLSPGATPLSINDLPDEPGLYALQARSNRALTELGLDDQIGQSPLLSRILYVGKAQDSVRKRLKDRHFAVGKTGSSTVRRTLAALLRLPAVPRPSKVPAPSRDQLMRMTTNYAVQPVDEKGLSAWMHSNLLIRAVATPWVPLANLERQAGAALEPPLDQENDPFWTPNPWRSHVAAARAGKRREARQRVGLV